jgi:hypothetical protein
MMNAVNAVGPEYLKECAIARGILSSIYKEKVITAKVNFQ